MKRILFLLTFTVSIWCIAFTVRHFGIQMIGLQLMAIILLFSSYWLRKTDGIRAWIYMIFMDLMLILHLVIVYLSRQFFTYFRYGSDLLEIVIVAGFFALAQLIGVFWGRRFYNEREK